MFRGIFILIAFLCSTFPVEALYDIVQEFSEDSVKVQLREGSRLIFSFHLPIEAQDTNIIIKEVKEGLLASSVTPSEKSSFHLFFSQSPRYQNQSPQVNCNQLLKDQPIFSSYYSQPIAMCDSFPNLGIFLYRLSDTSNSPAFMNFTKYKFHILDSP